MEILIYLAIAAAVGWMLYKLLQPATKDTTAATSSESAEKGKRATTVHDAGPFDRTAKAKENHRKDDSTDDHDGNDGGGGDGGGGGE